MTSPENPQHSEVRVPEQSASATGGTVTTSRDFVEVRLPAESAYVSVLRTVTAGLAARLDFTLDEIEDLRLAIDEACAMLLRQSVPGRDLVSVFELVGDAMLVTVSAPTTDGLLPARDTFAWTVLTALAGTVDAAVDDEKNVSISMHKQRGGPATP
jgi:serine/threonine-protein kinase RsbW